jgi:hypothetical protein
MGANVKISLCFAIVALVPAATFALDLKGLSPGKTVEEIKALYPKLDCTAKLEGRKNCYYKPPTKDLERFYPVIEELNTYAGVPVNAWFIMLTADDRVSNAGVRLHTNRFDQVSGALVEKYGPPMRRENSTVKTRNGVEHEQTLLTWTAGTEILQVRRIAGDINTMGVNLTSKDSLEEAEKRRGEEKKAGAKDL